MSNLTCLLIEDSYIQARIIAQMLSNCDLNVMTALNLQSGLATLKSQHIDLILSDLILPDAEDGSAASIIKESYPDIPLIAMTAGCPRNGSGMLLKNAKAAGAEFLLPKPFVFEKIKEVTSEIKSRKRAGGRIPHVLIIDDSSTMRIVCQKMLEDSGYRTSLADSIDSAIEDICVLDLDVILTDINMPGTSPFEFIPILRENMPGVGIVVMTGEENAKLNDVLLLGADTALSKPFSQTKLISAIRNAQVLASAALIELLKSQKQSA